MNWYSAEPWLRFCCGKIIVWGITSTLMLSRWLGRGKMQRQSYIAIFAREKRSCGRGRGAWIRIVHLLKGKVSLFKKEEGSSVTTFKKECSNVSLSSKKKGMYPFFGQCHQQGSPKNLKFNQCPSLSFFFETKSPSAFINDANDLGESIWCSIVTISRGVQEQIGFRMQLAHIILWTRFS